MSGLILLARHAANSPHMIIQAIGENSTELPHPVGLSFENPLCEGTIILPLYSIHFLNDLNGHVMPFLSEVSSYYFSVVFNIISMTTNSYMKALRSLSHILLTALLASD